MRGSVFVAVLLAAILGSGLARAQVPAAGTFTAQQACPATRSIRGGQGGGSVQPGQSYQLVGKNKADATFLQIVVDGSRLWVGVQCGRSAAGP